MPGSIQEELCRKRWSIRRRLRRIFCRSTAPITLNSTWATRARRRYYLPRRVRIPPGRLPRPGDRHARPRFLRAGAGQDPLRADHAARARASGRRARPAARRRRARYRAVGGRCRSRLARDHRAAARAACASRRRCATSTAKRAWPPSPPTATPSTPSSSGAITAACSCRASSRWTAEDARGAAGGPAAHRPHGGQRRLGRDEPLGGFLPRRHGLPHVQALRRQGHLHRILGADVEGDVERQRAREVSHQRAGRGQAQIADRRIPGVLPRPRRAAHRHGHRRHHRDGGRAAAAGRGVSARARHLLRRPAGARRPDRRADRRSCANWASWWTATTKATCCRSSRGRWKTGPRCSTK